MLQNTLYVTDSKKLIDCRQTLDVYLFIFAILLGQIKSKVNNRLVTYKLASP